MEFAKMYTIAERIWKGKALRKAGPAAEKTRSPQLWVDNVLYVGGLLA